MPQRHPTWHRLAEPLVNTPNRTHTTEHTRFRPSIVGVRRVGGWCFGEASTHLHQESSHGTQRQQLVVRGTDIVHSHCTPRRWEILQHPHMYMHRDHTAHGTMLVGHNTWTYIGEVAHGTVHGVTTANAAQRSNEVASSLQRHHLEWTHTQQAVACGSHATHGKGRHAATHVVVAFPGTLHRKVGVDGRQAGVLAVAMTTAGMAADFNRPQRIPDGDC